MHVTVLNCNTMHDHGTESRGHVLFRVTRGNTSGTCIETRFYLFQSVSSQTNTHYWYIVPLVSVCSSQHGLKQIKLCFKRAGCEAALRSDGRLYLQSYYSFIYLSCTAPTLFIWKYRVVGNKILYSLPCRLLPDTIF